MPDERCPHCSGTGSFLGRMNGPGWPMCPKCSGSGKVMIPDPTGSDDGLQLFERFSELSRGKPCDAVISSAINLLIVAVYQTHAGDREAVDRLWDAVCSKGKETLLRNFQPGEDGLASDALGN